MTYRFDNPAYAGYPAIEEIRNAPVSLNLLPISPGTIATAEDPVWGPGEFIFARANGAIRQYGLCVLTPVWNAVTRTFDMNMTEVPNTANLGRPLYVAQGWGAMSAGQYGWFLHSGVTPVNSNATVAADNACGIAAAGQAGALTASKQILNSRVITPASQTVTATSLAGLAGDDIIRLNTTDGFFVGGFLSGTGVGAGAVVSFIDPIQRFIRASVVNSAAVTGTVTQTANNATVFYNIAHFNRPSAQGAIT
jgi:hypothetical protein